METQFEAAFLKAVKKHASIKKLVKKKIDMIIQGPHRFWRAIEREVAGVLFMPGETKFHHHLPVLRRVPEKRG